jgi:single-strand DNA-binding protein
MLNKVTLMGRLTQDPQLRHLQGDNSVAIANFSLAVARDYKNKAGDRITDFFDIVAWRGKAEFVCKFFKKGQMMCLEGRLQLDRWEDEDGNKRRTYRIIAENIYFAESKKSQNDTQNNQTNNFIQADDDDSDDLPF